MKDAVSGYFEAIQTVITALEKDESRAIAQVGRLAAESIKNGGVLHVYDTGHMLTSELMGRAGGLLAWSPLTFSLTVHNPNRFRDKDPAPPPDDLEDLVKMALRRSSVRKGDLLFVGSVSGKTAHPVEVALQGKDIGAIVIGLTSVEHSRVLQSQHPSGKRLFEVADLVLDNHAPVGDAMLEFPGFDRRVSPASGLAAACAMWAVNARIVECLLEMGIQPSVYSSVNLPDGPENVRNIEARYTEVGY